MPPTMPLAIRQFWCPESDSNRHCMGFESISSAVGIPGLQTSQSNKRRLGTLLAVTLPTPRRVLIAEDEALIRLDLKEMLEEEGYAVVGEAADGQQAVELAEELRPDLVILDVKMPGLDGISAAEQIVANAIAPVIMLTAFSQRELVERAADAGAMAYLVKPFDSSDLRARDRGGDQPASAAPRARRRGRRPHRAARDAQAGRPGQEQAADRSAG